MSSKKKFKAGEVYEALSDGRVVGSFAAAQAEQMAESPIYRNLEWRHIESKTIAEVPKGVRKAKEDKAIQKAIKDEGDIEPSPADGQNQ